MMDWRKLAWIQEISGAVWLWTLVMSFWMRASPVGTYWALTSMPGCACSNLAMSSLSAGTVEETVLCQKVMMTFPPAPSADFFPQEGSPSKKRMEKTVQMTVRINPSILNPTTACATNGAPTLLRWSNAHLFLSLLCPGGERTH